jgi:hypothetical protein
LALGSFQVSLGDCDLDRVFCSLREKWGCRDSKPGRASWSSVRAWEGDGSFSRPKGHKARICQCNGTLSGTYNLHQSNGGGRWNEEAWETDFRGSHPIRQVAQLCSTQLWKISSMESLGRWACGRALESQYPSQSDQKSREKAQSCRLPKQQQQQLCLESVKRRGPRYRKPGWVSGGCWGF